MLNNLQIGVEFCTFASHPKVVRTPEGAMVEKVIPEFKFFTFFLIEDFYLRVS
jgi:hypothetical protein